MIKCETKCVNKLKMRNEIQYQVRDWKLALDLRHNHSKYLSKLMSGIVLKTRQSLQVNKIVTTGKGDNHFILILPLRQTL